MSIPLFIRNKDGKGINTLEAKRSFTDENNLAEFVWTENHNSTYTDVLNASYIQLQRINIWLALSDSGEAYKSIYSSRN